MLKKIIGKWNAIIRGLRILNYEYFSTRNDCLGKCGVNSHYLPPTLLGKRENIFCMIMHILITVVFCILLVVNW